MKDTLNGLKVSPWVGIMALGRNILEVGDGFQVREEITVPSPEFDSILLNVP